MTLYLARKVANGVVDETSTVYIARCDVTDCRYLADHVSTEVVEDALAGHTVRAHPSSTPRSEDMTRTGWIPAWGYGPIASETASADAPPPAWAPAPREEQ